MTIFVICGRNSRKALELFDEQGRITDLAEREAEIAVILALMCELGDEKLKQEVKSFAAGLESSWGYYQRAAR